MTASQQRHKQARRADASRGETALLQNGDAAETQVPAPEMAATQVPSREMAETQIPAAGLVETVAGDGAAEPPSSAPKDPVEAVVAQLQQLSAAGKIDYKDITLLGVGGMGVVCLAHQISLDRKVALKVLKQELASNASLVERFIREARAMAKINHPNVVQGYAVGEAEGLNYVAMELVDGQSMQDVLDAQGAIPISDAVLVTLVTAEALQHAHELKMIHRDIKPDNILVTSKGQVKVADLGLAKATDEDMSMTQSGTGLGTPHYMPPEQARNAKYVDVRSDIYALGATLYHFVTGGLPFSAESVVELIMEKEKGTFPPVRQKRPECPEKLGLIVDKMMATKPDHRYQTMDLVIQDLLSLGLATDTLSCVEGAEPVRRNASAATLVPGASSRAAGARPGSGVSRGPAAASKPTVGQGGGQSTTTWFLKLPGPDGKERKLKASTGEILAQIRKGRLDTAATRIATNAKGPFLTLAQVPIFEKELQRDARTKANEKRSDKKMKSKIAKIDRQWRWRKVYRFFGKLKDGTLGLAGLVLYLGAIGVLLFLGYFYGWPKVQELINGEQAPSAATAPADPSAEAANKNP